ncbi:MAG: transcription-repair coupling factor [Micavibrio aeruginosavorus]|uniref:Transcription-repair-coupling factor n=1 Tax=Micavibrio aeruginosavorus TaxID=349221 RepID=A0A7T5UJ08_9BACT|nr:MAG: transcription-repair coupling factor [Micavibrio aeruginosavorus]
MSQPVEKRSLSVLAHPVIHGAPEGQDARLLIERARAIMPDDRVLIHVAMDDARVAGLQELIAFFAPDVKVMSFPAWDCLPYDRVSPNVEIVAQRVAALCALIGWERQRERHPRILLTTVNAITQKVTPKSVIAGASLVAERGGSLKQEHLQTFLHNNGYNRTDTVREHGEYAFRGGIVDIFPPGYDEPVRLDLFGDEIESIRTFDPASQRTDKKLSRLVLHPATEFFLDDDSIARFRAGYRELFGVIHDNDPLYESISAGRRYNGMDHWLPLFFERMDTLFDYAPNALVTMDQAAEQARTERLTQIADFYQARRTLEDAGAKRKLKKDGADVSLSGAIYHPLPWPRLYLNDEEWAAFLKEAFAFSPFGAMNDAEEGARRGRDFADIRALPNGDIFKALSDHASELGRSGRKILIAAYSMGSRERLRSLMLAAGFAGLSDIAGAEDLKRLDRFQIGMCVLALEHGFIAPDLAVITEQDILGDRLARASKKRKKADNFLREVSSLAPGDLVVHIDHGIGRFESLETVEAAGTLHDCLKLVYDGGDRLFVPVENIEVLSRFGGEGDATQLDRLGGVGWQARKARVRKDLMIMAEGLLKIAAARQLQRGEVMEAVPAYNDFVARFPYQETEDQQRAIDDVQKDLISGQPMDRLVCGDVGFGKTEIALRAAYVAAMHGVQVAVVVPTTLLARQHYNNFSQRFAGTGIRVGQLSRMVSARDAELTRKGLTDGSVNIVVGTHAILAEKIKFAHLGLLIVDEEQRFGVKQKEKLKELKANVHVLTLTATPIPRTLQMALTGVRDMSVIASPPVDRLAIRTFVLPFDPVVIREAILREHYRGGQSFYVCPRVKDIQDVEDMLKELVPEVKIISAHGQMGAQELEDRMTAFYDGQYNVLLATNIIENGIDIPTANTMIVHRSDLFGLAQLYQIRGRIGRSKVRAYAYLTYEANKRLTDQAQRRLEVLETLDTLGAGFQLASHDMDIRGAGNLLGEEQSGHIREVGVELYQQMLEEAVAAAREGSDIAGGEAIPDKWSPQINLGTSVLIPEHYVADLNVRMSLYRRLSELEDKPAIEGFAAEMIDRFGPLPEEFENLLSIVAIKQYCRMAGVDRLDAGPKGVVIGFYKDSPPNVPGLMKWMQEKGGSVKLRPDQKLFTPRQWMSTQQRVKGVESLVKELAAAQAV